MPSIEQLNEESWYAMPLSPRAFALFAVTVDGSTDQIVLKGLALVGAISLGGYIAYKIRHTINENANGFGDGGKSLLAYWYDCREIIITRRARMKQLKRQLESASPLVHQSGDKRGTDDKKDQEAA